MEQKREPGPAVDSRAEPMDDVRTLIAAYAGMLEEWHRCDGEEISSDYRTVLLVLLGAEGYIAYSSPLDNWLTVLVVAGISLFGLMLERHGRTMGKVDAAIYADAALACRELEAKLLRTGIFNTGLMHNLFGRAKSVSIPLASLSLYRLFGVTFIVIPVALALATLLMTIPLTHPYIHPLLSR